MDTQNRNRTPQQAERYSPVAIFMEITSAEILTVFAETDCCKEALFPRLRSEIQAVRQHVSGGGHVGAQLLTDIARLLATRLRDMLLKHEAEELKRLAAWDSASEQRYKRVEGPLKLLSQPSAYVVEYWVAASGQRVGCATALNAYRAAMRQAVLSACVWVVALIEHELSIVSLSTATLLADAIRRQDSAWGDWSSLDMHYDGNLERLELELEPDETAQEAAQRSDDADDAPARRAATPVTSSDDDGGSYAHDDYPSPYGSVNPSSGLPMMGSTPFDVGGNVYGTGNW